MRTGKEWAAREAPQQAVRRFERTHQPLVSKFSVRSESFRDSPALALDTRQPKQRFGTNPRIFACDQNGKCRTRRFQIACLKFCFVRFRKSLRVKSWRQRRRGIVQELTARADLQGAL